MNTLDLGARGVVCGLSILISAAAVDAADRHVPGVYPTIQAGIDAAHPGDVVLIADGVYTGDGNRDLSFHGKAITVRSVNGPETCTIDCQGTPEVPFRGFAFTDGETPASRLEGITITGGATLPGAIADQFNGGAILCNNGSSPTIVNCHIENNGCGCWGGAICCSGASPRIEGCRIIGNHADDDGGAIFAWNDSSPTIVNTVIAGNDATVIGGGMALFGGSATVMNVTVVGNVSQFGGGIHAWQTTISNSIIWGNGPEQVVNAGDNLVSHSNIQGGFEGPGNIDVDPGFVDAAGLDFHLLPDSPLVDAAGAVPASLTVDMDGDPRLIGDRVDIGADEVHRVGDLNFDGDIDVADLVQLMLAWGVCPQDAVRPADFDQNGLVDVADLVQLLLGWG